MKPHEAIAPKYLDGGLDVWMSGQFTGSFADQQIEAVNGGPIIMSTMMDEAWVKANLDDPSSPVFQAVLANDTTAKPGTPAFSRNTMPNRELDLDRRPREEEGLRPRPRRGGA
ncbi:MAG: hypothetical protein WB493_05210 [Anaeromyxobacteraceae bacterium]